MTGSALATADRASSIAPVGAIEIRSIAEVFRLAEALAGARGFVPKTLIGDPGGIAAAILTGLELGIGPMESMRVIHMVEGRPTMAADYILARAIRAGIVHVWERSDDAAAILRLSRGGRTYRQPWTIEEAQRAGLTRKDNWKNYPAAMLRARATSAAMCAFAPDVLGAGVYLRDEIEGEGEGEPLDAMPAPIETSPAPAPVASVARLSAPPARLSEVGSDSELREWCEAHREGFAAITDPARLDDARAKLRAAAERCDVDAASALAWAGLGDEAG